MELKPTEFWPKPNPGDKLEIREYGGVVFDPPIQMEAIDPDRFSLSLEEWKRLMDASHLTDGVNCTKRTEQ